MTYLGNTPTSQSFVAGTDYFNGDGMNKTFTLSRVISSGNDIAVIVDNQFLRPPAPPAVVDYTVTPTTITFSIAPSTGTSNVIIRYMTTILYENTTFVNQNEGYLYRNYDVSSNFSAVLTDSQVIAIPSAGQLQVSPNALGFAIGDIISAANFLFTGVIITAIDNATNTLTVVSTDGWGTVGVGNLKSPYIYKWSTPNQGALLSYDRATQQWVNTSVQLITSNGNIALGANTLNVLNSTTTARNNVLLGNNSGKAIVSSANNIILGGYTGFSASAPTLSPDLRTSSATSNGWIVISDAVLPTSNVRAVFDPNGQFGLGTATPLALFHVEGSARLAQILEKTTVDTTAIASIITYNVQTNGAITYFTTPSSGNFTFDFWANKAATPQVTLNSILPLGHSLTIAIMTSQGVSPNFCTPAPTIDGSSSNITMKWQGSSAPSFGYQYGIDVYLFTIIKTASTPAYTILGSQTQFGG